MTLTEFLLARIAEDEAAAREATPGPWSIDPREYPDAQHIGRHDPSRVLAECEAKRRIVEMHAETTHPLSRWTAWREPTPGLPLICEECSGDDDPYIDQAPYPCATMRHLATIWADHPDYRPEWKP